MTIILNDGIRSELTDLAVINEYLDGREAPVIGHRVRKTGIARDPHGGGDTKGKLQLVL